MLVQQCYLFYSSVLFLMLSLSNRISSHNTLKYSLLCRIKMDLFCSLLLEHVIRSVTF